MPCATIVLNVYETVPKPQVSAVGKYCYVVPSEDELDFGDQPVVAGGGGSGNDHGSRPRKDFTLRNQSVVPAAFNVSGANLNNERTLYKPIGPAWPEFASKIRWCTCSRSMVRFESNFYSTKIPEPNVPSPQLR